MPSFAETFYYCEDSPSGLRWIDNRYCGNGNTVLNAAKDSVAGSKNCEGYWMVYCKWKHSSMGCHRIVFTLHYGEIPDGIKIDHIDGDRSNNSIGNLRLVTDKGNSRNQKMRYDNKSGIKGVRLHTSTSGFVSFTAQWSESSGKRVSKYFGVDKYGYEVAKQLAFEARKSALIRISDEDTTIGYTTRHLDNNHVA